MKSKQNHKNQAKQETSLDKMVFNASNYAKMSEKFSKGEESEALWTTGDLSTECIRSFEASMQSLKRPHSLKKSSTVEYQELQRNKTRKLPLRREKRVKTCKLPLRREKRITPNEDNLASERNNLSKRKSQVRKTHSSVLPVSKKVSTGFSMMAKVLDSQEDLDLSAYRGRSKKYNNGYNGDSEWFERAFSELEQMREGHDDSRAPRIDFLTPECTDSIERAIDEVLKF